MQPDVRALLKSLSARLLSRRGKERFAAGRQIFDILRFQERGSHDRELLDNIDPAYLRLADVEWEDSDIKGICQIADKAMTQFRWPGVAGVVGPWHSDVTFGLAVRGLTLASRMRDRNARFTQASALIYVRDHLGSSRHEKRPFSALKRSVGAIRAALKITARAAARQGDANLASLTEQVQNELASCSEILSSRQWPLE